METAKEIKFNNQHANGDDSQTDDYINNELDFEFVLFASVIIDYDYIMQLITKLTGKETKQKLTKEQIVNLIKSNSNFMEDGDDLIDYVYSLKEDNLNGKTVEEVKKDFENFQKEKYNKEITDISAAFGLQYETLNAFVEKTVNRLIFDGDSLTDLFEPQDLGWRERVTKEKEFMARIAPLLKRMAKGKDISGLNAWEE